MIFIGYARKGDMIEQAIMINPPRSVHAILLGLLTSSQTRVSRALQGGHSQSLKDGNCLWDFLLEARSCK